jgi:hypothetical protein
MRPKRPNAACSRNEKMLKKFNVLGFAPKSASPVIAYTNAAKKRGAGQSV